MFAHAAGGSLSFVVHAPLASGSTAHSFSETPDRTLPSADASDSPVSATVASLGPETLPNAVASELPETPALSAETSDPMPPDTACPVAATSVAETTDPRTAANVCPATASALDGTKEPRAAEKASDHTPIVIQLG